MRDLVLANNNFDIHAHVAGAAENFYNASSGGEAAVGKFQDFYVDDGAIELRNAFTGICGARQLQFCGEGRRQLFAGRNYDFG